MRKWIQGFLVLSLIAIIGCFSTSRERYVKEHADQLNQEQMETILAGRLYIGMSREAVLAAIGRPTRINADFLGHQVVWHYDYDRTFGSRNRGVFKTTFIVEFKDDTVYNWRED